MPNTNYYSIKTKSTKETFLDYINSIDIPQIDYFAIGIQDTYRKKSISIMSNEEWQKKFSEYNYAAFDPVRRVTFLTKRNVIPFNEIDHVDNFGKEIMRQRALLGIKNGIILMRRFPKYNYMITLGTSFSNFDGCDFLKRYHDRLDVFKQEITKIVKKDSIAFLQKTK